uniref:DAZ-associated protein 2 n=1 Tax=Arion vulgaris TaxID=1028688 RepID=A0A0B6ZAL6_9EUPU
MSYPKDPYYEKPPLGGNSYYSNTQQMVPPTSGQQLPPEYHNAPPAYNGAPPPYSSVPSTMPGAVGHQYQSSQFAYNTGMPPQAQHYPPNNMVNSAPPPYASYGHPTYNPGYPVQQGFVYAAPPTAAAHFDSGARFDGIATHNIPPPPPGCAPNAAQLAVAQGGTVVATQKKAGWFSGSGGGVSLW